jgi:hypothetical protein
MVRKITLPAVEVEVPRMGMVVYVSPKVGVQDNKWTCMFTAEIVMDDTNIEIQSFHLKCKSQKEAEQTIKNMTERLKKYGDYPFIQNKF